MRQGFPLGLAVEPRPKEPLTGLFQHINSVIPEDQQLTTLPSHTTVHDALELMKSHGFSQLPIKAGNEIIGVFSYRSFALGQLHFADKRTSVLDLPIADFLEDLPFMSINDRFGEVIDILETRDAVLVGTLSDLTAIVTPMDILRYLYGVTSPYIIVAEVELAIRALMRWSADSTEIAECIRRGISDLYRDRIEKIPTKAEQLTFGDYSSVIGHGDNWNRHFQHVFGSTRVDVRAKLDRFSEIRNHLFHFHREITISEFEELTQVRDWLLRRCKLTQNRQESGRLEVAI